MRLVARWTLQANFRAYPADLDPFQTHVALSLASRARSVLRSAIGRRALHVHAGKTHVAASVPGKLPIPERLDSKVLPPDL
jgi:hypothetical protein